MAFFNVSLPYQFGVYPAYQPTTYNVFIAYAGVADPVPALEVEVFVNNTSQGVFFPSLFAVTTFGLSTLYAYQFDPGSVVRDFFNNRDTLRTPGEIGFKEGTTWQASAYLQFTEWLPDSNTGKLVRDPNTTNTSSPLVFVNATANAGREIFNLSTWSLIPYEYMTEKSDRVVIGYDESEFLYFLGQNITHTQYLFYDQDDTLLGYGFIAHNQLASSFNNVGSVPVGPASINAFTASDWDGPVTGTVGVSSAVKYYVVRSGLRFVSGTMTVLTNARRYYPCEQKFRKYRLHFLNQYGVFDSFSVLHDNQEAYETTSGVFRQTPSGVITADREVDRRTQSRSRTRLEGRVQNIIPQDEQFYLQFIRSVNVYLEESGTMYPILVDDQETTMREAGRGLFELPFAAYFSEDQVSQRN